MSKRARTTIIVFLTVFLVLCGITVLLFRLPYLASRFTYGGTSASFTEQQEPQPAQPVQQQAAAQQPAAAQPEAAPASQPVQPAYAAPTQESVRQQLAEQTKKTEA